MSKQIKKQIAEHINMALIEELNLDAVKKLLKNAQRTHDHEAADRSERRLVEITGKIQAHERAIGALMISLNRAAFLSEQAMFEEFSREQ